MLILVLLTLLLHTIESEECGFTYADNYAFSGSQVIFKANTLESAKASCIADNTCIGFYKSNGGAGYNLMEAGTWMVYPAFEGWKKECPVSVPPECNYEYANNYDFAGTDVIFAASTLSEAKAYCSLDNECIGFHKVVSGASYYVMRSGDWRESTNYEGWKKQCSTGGVTTEECVTDICDLEGKIDSVYAAVTGSSANSFGRNNVMDWDNNHNNKIITFSLSYIQLISFVFIIILLMGFVGLSSFFVFRKLLKDQRLEYSKVQNIIEVQ